MERAAAAVGDAIDVDGFADDGDAVGHFGAGFEGEGMERPIGIGDHANAAFAGEEDGPGRRFASGLDRGLAPGKYPRRVVEEPIHVKLFGARRGYMRRII